MRKLALLFLLAPLFFGCKEESDEKFLPDSVGAINTVSVIVDNELWKGAVGDSIRRHFAAPVLGLPVDEPLFSLSQMPPEVFTDFARSSRNVLIVDIDTSTVAGIKDNLYAKPQKVAVLKAPSKDSLYAQLNRYSEEIIQTFKKQDLEENQRRFYRSLNKETALQEGLGISLTMPSIYKLVKQENNFYWIERMIQKGTMNIIAYEMPLHSIPTDSTRVDAIIRMRDSIGERYIPGREEGMYMITEKAYAPYVFDATVAGRNAVETRGMWEVKNFFMAGPFINYIIEDVPNNRLLVLEGFTFAPSTDKRDYMFELEAIMRTLKFTGEEEVAGK